MLTITIQLDPRDKADTLDLHLEAIGFSRATATSYKGQQPGPSTAIGLAANHKNGDPTDNSIGNVEIVQPSENLRAAGFTGQNPEKLVDAPAREPGKPAPGHRRRTNAEIAEDEAYLAAQSQTTVAGSVFIHTPAGQDARLAAAQAKTDPVSDASHAAEGSSIFGDAGGSSDSYETAVGANPADAAQDAADEAAEAAANKTDALTLDDLRNAAGAYQKAHGPLAAIKNIPIILGKPLTEHAPHEIEEAIRKIRIATEAPVVTNAPVVQQHIEENKPVVPPTLDDVKAALGRYAAKYDGRTDLGKETTPITNEDGSRIVKQAVGADNLRDMPKDEKTLALLIAAIDAAVAGNPFKREIRG